MEYSARKEGRLERTTFLQVRPEVILTDGVLISADVSNKAGVDTFPIVEGLDALDLTVIYQDTEWRNKEIQARRKAAKKYEILVPNNVSTDLIVGL